MKTHLAGAAPDVGFNKVGRVMSATPKGSACLLGVSSGKGGATEWLRVYDEHPCRDEALTLAGRACRFAVAKGAVKDFVIEGEPICALRDALVGLGWTPTAPLGRRRVCLAALLDAAETSLGEGAEKAQAVSEAVGNPFLVAEMDACERPFGVDTAVALSVAAGLPKQDICRLACRHMIRGAEAAGNVCSRRSFYVRSVHAALAKAATFPRALVEGGVLECEGRGDLVRRGEVVYSRAAFEAEGQIVDFLLSKKRRSYSTDPAAGGRGSPDPPAFLTGEQRAALEKAVGCFRSGGVAVLTGGAGVGKSATVSAVSESLGLDRVILAAPTGKAARGLANKTGAACGVQPIGYTLHRLLGIGCKAALMTEREMRNRKARRADDVAGAGQLLVVDEASMLDLWMMRSVCRAAGRHGLSLLFVGDPHQLPSVGPGNVMRDLVEWSREAGTLSELTEVQRQGPGCPVASLGEAIRKEDLSRCDELLRSGHPSIDLVEPIDSGVGSVIKCYEEAGGLRPNRYASVQIISSRKDGPASTQEINAACVLKKDPGRACTPWGGPKLVAGDKVVVTKNASASELDGGGDAEALPHDPGRNGDIGELVSHERRSAVVEQSGERGGAPKKLIARSGDIDHGHAVTVHKFQGSEADTVIVVLHQSHQRMMYNNLIYTAVTRARKKLVVVGKASLFLAAVSAEAPPRLSRGFIGGSDQDQPPHGPANASNLAFAARGSE